MRSSDSSSGSSVTMTEPERDVESQRSGKELSYIHRQFDQAGVTSAVMDSLYKGSGTIDDPFIVDFLPDDPKDPMKFPMSKKWGITVLQAFSVLAVTFNSTAYSGGISEVIRDFNISTEVAILGVSLFVAGFALGPVLWAPRSELYGRQILFAITFMALTVFNAGAAGAPNIQTFRGLATSIFAAAPFLGPSIGPIAGGFLGVARGVEGLMAAFSGVLWILCLFLVPETYTPILLRRRAEKLSRTTGKVYLSKIDASQPKQTVAREFKVSLSRPWILLFREPIVLLASLYVAIVYGTLYLMFAAFPIVFQQQRGWSPGIGGLAFLGVAVGMMAAVAYSIYDNRRYGQVAAAHGGHAPPEARLPPAIIGSVLLPVGLFWFAWTNGADIHWIVCIVASGFFAAGLVLVFLSLINYLIDSCVIYAASVLAANSVLRSLFGAAFPLFTTAISIPAFLAVACMPFPFLFYKYGASIRMKCKYAAEAAEVLKRMRSNPGESRPGSAGTAREANEVREQTDSSE
ncbi:major facilitator superfamily transporter [Hypoxylon sp. NC1633]|nr:major facilitator superfamily transporter [Hypoxylon sp. NC1633]